MGASSAIRGPAGVLAAFLPILARQDGQRAVKNVAALSIAQAASGITPLLILPYTASVLGPGRFGTVALLQAAVQYSTLITNYGFSYSGTRSAALAQKDFQKLAQIVAHVLLAKALLMCGCLAASSVIIAATPALRPYLIPYLFAFVTVIGNTLYLDWFFQAIEEMKWITVITVVPKLTLLPLVFVFVKRPSDYVWALLIQSISFLSSGIAGLALVRYRLGVRIPLPAFSGVIAELKTGWQAFLATVFVNVYTSSNTLLLGVLTDASTVGCYAAAQKVISALQAMWSPVSQTLYPHFCKRFHEDRANAAAQLKRLVVMVLGIALAGAITICVAAPYLVPRYLGKTFGSSVLITQILVFSLPAITVSNIFGLHGLLAAGMSKPFARSLGGGAAANLLMAPVAIWAWGPVGLGATVVVVEVCICVLQRRTLRKAAII